MGCTCSSRDQVRVLPFSTPDHVHHLNDERKAAQHHRWVDSANGSGGADGAVSGALNVNDGAPGGNAASRARHEGPPSPHPQQQIYDGEEELPAPPASWLSRSLVNWDRHFDSISQSQLQKKREEFFDTRIEGNPNMWAAIRSALDESLLHDDHSTANAILRGAELSEFQFYHLHDEALVRNNYMNCPIFAFCYDKTGVKYELPMYVLRNPKQFKNECDETDKKLHGDSLDPPGVVPDSAPVQDRLLALKIRLSNGLPDVQWPDVSSSTLLSALKHRMQRDLQIPVAAQRWFCKGRMLLDAEKADSWPVSDGTILQVLVVRRGSTDSMWTVAPPKTQPLACDKHDDSKKSVAAGGELPVKKDETKKEEIKKEEKKKASYSR